MAKCSIVVLNKFPICADFHSIGRYAVISSKKANAQLHAELKNFSTFTLVENQIYIKFIYEEDTAKTEAAAVMPGQIPVQRSDLPLFHPALTNF